MAAPDPPAKFSLALGSKKAAPPNTKKRPHSTLQDSDDEDAGAPAAQEVSHFDASAGGAIDASKPKEDKGPLVIPKLLNRDWHAEGQQRKRQKSQLPARPQANGNGAAADDKFEEEKPLYGLNVVKKADDAEQADGDAAESTAPPTEPTAAPPAAPKTEDELALQALLGEGTQSDLVLPLVYSEEDAFRRDYETAPAPATEADYEAVPVEQFGAAMLRGMGWKEGEAVGRRKGLKAVQPRVLEKRPALMGIGAKPDAAIAEELGAWGKGGGKGKRKQEQSYNPIMLRNKATGEQMTEEELKQKIAEQEAAELERERAKKKEVSARDSEKRVEKSSRRHRSDEDDHESDRRDRDRRRREKDSDRDYDSKHRSSRRDRSASEEDRHRRHKYDSKDYDRRDKDRERDRDRDRDRKHRDRSREGYSKSSSRRDHRDRSRDKYRDSDRDRRRRRDG